MHCPYCGLEEIHTFIDRATNELRHRCGSLNQLLPEGACGRELPLYIVDEDAYSRLPTLLVGTLDKIANITFRPASRTFSGLSPMSVLCMDLLLTILVISKTQLVDVLVDRSNLSPSHLLTLEFL